MNAGAGWYPDPDDTQVTRYWDGGRYTEVRHWNGSAWVDPAVSAPPPPPGAMPPVATPAASTPAPPPVVTNEPPVPGRLPDPPVDARPAPPGWPAAPGPGAVAPPGAAGAPRPKPTPTFWIFMAASLGVAVSALLPWVSVSGFGVATGISNRPGTGGPGVLIVFAVAVAAIAWPTIASPRLSNARKIGLIPLVGFLAVAVVTNWSDLADLEDKYRGVNSLGISIDAGVGFYLYTVCVIALVVAVVRVWLAGARATAPA